MSKQQDFYPRCSPRNYSPQSRDTPPKRGLFETYDKPTDDKVFFLPYTKKLNISSFEEMMVS